MKPAVLVNTSTPAHRLQSVLQVNVTLLTCLAAAIFAQAEGALLPAVTIPLAIAALFVTDRQQRFVLSVPWANALGVAAFIAALIEFFSGGIEARLLAFGHLLVYLTWVLLFQAKTQKQYWWICALAILQIATGSVLTQGLWFGASLLVFFVVALWTLSVFSLQRAVRKSEGEESQSREREARPCPSVRFSSIKGLAPPGRHAGRSMSRNSMTSEVGHRLLDWRFITGVAVYALLSLVVSGLFFALTPRVWVGRFQFLRDTPMPGERTLTGFTEQVRLGDLGEILESADLVMQVSLLDAATSRPLGAARIAALTGTDDPLFRGIVLSHYSDGQWSPAEISLDDSAPMIEEINRHRTDLIQQEIRLQPIGTHTVFVLNPGLACFDEERQRHGGIRWDLLTGVFRRQPRGHNEENWSTGPFTYRAWSWKAGRTSSEPVRSNPRQDRLLAGYRDELLRLPRSLESLRELTDQIIDQAPVEVTRTPATVARELEAYLRDSGRFSYTLSLSIQDPTIDPVEDFLFNRMQGHCEYFASALALMLRAAGIPSRLISGFKGGDFNEKTGRYEVRQLHAHAWVEAWVDGQWLVLDPTPSGRDATVQSMATTGNYLWTDWNNRLKSAWNTATMLTPQQQQALFYDPAVGSLKSWWSDLQAIRPDVDRMKEFVTSLRSPRQWFSWRGGVTAFVLGVLIAGMILGGRRAWKRLRRRWGTSLGRGGRRERIVVPFFERFCRIAASAGLPRPPAQTQREFAETFAQQLGDPGDHGPQGWNVEQLVDAFYRIRFGREELAESDYADLNRQLDRLEGWLMNGGRSRVAT